MDLAKHTILNNSFRDAKMPGGPQVSPQKTQSIAKNEGSCKYCCDMRNERRFAKSEVQYNPEKVTLNIEKNRFEKFFFRTIDKKCRILNCTAQCETNPDKWPFFEMCERSELVNIYQFFCSFFQTRHLTVELSQP